MPASVICKVIRHFGSHERADLCGRSRQSGAVAGNLNCMSAKFYACFILQRGTSSGCRELGSVIELCPGLHAMDLDEVAEILAEDLDVASEDVRVYHFSRLH